MPPRVSLGCFPTRIQFLKRISDGLGGALLYVKRDDESGSDLSGNKVRKLEFLLADALDRGADLVITCGGVQSNHCRATAVAARRLGIDSLLFLRGEDPGDRDGNLLLEALVGAELRFITPEAYARRREVLDDAAREAKAAGRRPYIIPEGGSNALGSMGYVSFLEELEGQSLPERFPWDHIVCATGSGGTLAGLLLGAKLKALPVRIWGVNVCDTAAYFRERVLEIAEEFRRSFMPQGAGSSGVSSEPVLRPEEIRILEGYKGPGYGKTYPGLLELIREVAREDGLFLDPVYTGKALFGLLQEAGHGRFGSGERILFLHTGGIFSLYARRKELLGS